MSAVSTEVVDSPDGLEGLEAQWDALATECGQPYLLLAWIQAWWVHRKPGRAALRLILVRDGTELIGAGPWFVNDPGARWPQYHLVGRGTFFRLDPLSRPRREAEVAQALAAALAHASPRPALVRAEGTDASSPWPERLIAAWPGPRRPVADLDRARTVSAPTLVLEGTFEHWLETRSSNFRRQLRKRRRQAEEAGVELHETATPDELAGRVAALARLHTQSWVARGGPGALVDGDEEMMREAGGPLLASGRVRLFALDVQGEPIAAYLCGAAGGRVVPFLLGFNPAWGHLSPGLQVISAAVEDAFRRGDRIFDFGFGPAPYKLRFSDRDDPLVWKTLVPPGGPVAPMRGRLAIEHGVSRARPVLRRLKSWVQR